MKTNYQLAQDCLEKARQAHEYTPEAEMYWLARAQVYATLATTDRA